MEVMGGDIGRNIFFVPLAIASHLEQIPWVESAERNAVCAKPVEIEIHETNTDRICRIGPRFSLIDATGVADGTHRPANANIHFLSLWE